MISGEGMERSSEIENLVRALYFAISEGDSAGLDELIGDDADVLLIGTDPDEWWAGHDVVVSHWKTQLKEMAGVRLEQSPQLRAFQEGNVAWFADQPSIITPDGARTPIRFTAVLHQEQGAWKIIQVHGSIGVTNEAAIGLTLTT
jgi:hypothetical protein